MIKQNKELYAGAAVYIFSFSSCLSDFAIFFIHFFRSFFSLLLQLDNWYELFGTWHNACTRIVSFSLATNKKSG